MVKLETTSTAVNTDNIFVQHNMSYKSSQTERVFGRDILLQQWLAFCYVPEYVIERLCLVKKSQHHQLNSILWVCQNMNLIFLLLFREIPYGTLFQCWSEWPVAGLVFTACNLNLKISERLIKWQYCLKIFDFLLTIITFYLIRIDIGSDLLI